MVCSADVLSTYIVLGIEDVQTKGNSCPLMTIFTGVYQTTHLTKCFDVPLDCRMGDKELLTSNQRKGTN